MIYRVAESIINLLYSSVTVFLFYYMVMMLVDFNTMTVRFHPPTDVVNMLPIFMVILSGVTVFKILLALSNAVIYKRSCLDR